MDLLRTPTLVRCVRLSLVVRGAGERTSNAPAATVRDVEAASSPRRSPSAPSSLGLAAMARSRTEDLRDHELGGLGPLAPWSLIMGAEAPPGELAAHRRHDQGVVTMIVRLMGLTLSARHLRVDRRPVAVACSVIVW